MSNSANFNVSGGAQRTLTGNLSNNAGGVLDTAAATPLLVTGVLTNAATGQIQAGANITVGADYNNLAAGNGNAFNHRANVTGAGLILAAGNVTQAITCLLYTSDAADQRSRVDLGGRRILKKKTNKKKNSQQSCQLTSLSSQRTFTHALHLCTMS